jgi:transcriptional regulator with XRE-family HTH domain
MPNPIDVYVGSRLRMRRAMLGLSQNKMGELIGVTFQQIQKYEKGVNRIGSSRLYQISKILLVPISYFFEGYEEANGTSGMVKVAEREEAFRYEDLDNKEIAQLIKNFIRITNPVIRKSVISLAKSLAAKEDSAQEETCKEEN